MSNKCLKRLTVKNVCYSLLGIRTARCSPGEMYGHPRVGGARAPRFGCRGTTSARHRTDAPQPPLPDQTRSPVQAPLVALVLFPGPSVSRPLTAIRGVLLPSLSSATGSLCFAPRWCLSLGAGDPAVGGRDCGIQLHPLPP